MQNLISTEVSIKTKILSSKDGAKTFSITKEIDGIKSGGHGYFILLYPTRTADNAYIEDSTNNHILNHMKELGLKSYTVINLFSNVTQSRLSLSGLYVDEENLDFIKEQVFKNLPENSKVVIAWGNANQTSPVVCQSKQRILELWIETQPSKPLYQMSVEGLPKDNIGVHPLYLGIRYSQAYWKLADYPHKKVLQQLNAQMEAKKTKSNKSASKTEKEEASIEEVPKGGKGKKNSKN